MRAGAAWLVAVSACGGADHGRPSEPPPPAPIEDPGSGPVWCDVPFELVVLDDFELGAARPGFYATNGACDDCEPLRKAVYAALDAGADASAELSTLRACRARCQASQSPTSFETPLPAALIPHGRCDSAFALHVSATDLSGYGGMVALRFARPLDARPFVGIAFYGRVAPGSRTSLRVEVTEPGTDPATGACDAHASLDHPETACDRFGAYATLSPDWQLVTLPFDELRQAGFGAPVPAPDLASVRGIGFSYGAGSWELWLDDVALYR